MDRSERIEEQPDPVSQRVRFVRREVLSTGSADIAAVLMDLEVVWTLQHDARHTQHPPYSRPRHSSCGCAGQSC